jgi:hypothetical protein
MSPAIAVCASCGHVLAEREALDPCSRCGSAERTLRREELTVDRSDPDRVIEQRRVEELRPDGSCDVTEEPIEATARPEE